MQEAFKKGTSVCVVSIMSCVRYRSNIMHDLNISQENR